MEGKKGTRTGFSTGACATAATKGALLALLRQEVIGQIEITLPVGQRVVFSIAECNIGPNEARCGVIKDAGDDPDVTHGATIRATVSFIETPGAVLLEAGEGVGRVTQPGLGLPVGAPDITRVPRKMMTDVVEELAAAQLRERGMKVVLSVPGGEELAKKTELIRLGVIGGIGILGTTGIVRPYSTAAFRAGIGIGVASAAARGYRHLVVTTGGMSEKFALRWIDLPEGAFIQMGDFVGYALEQCVKRHIERVTISGMIGKLSKMAMGKMMTHAAGSDVDTGFLAQLAGLSGAPEEVVEEILEANTARQVAEIAQARGLAAFFDRLAVRVCEACRRHVKGELEIECLLTDFEGNVIGRGRVGNGSGKGSATR
ncbi:MAG: cobalt-precorrin-5B (C(1))-methyltransferase [Candidatus Manganitrophaceae bacterium]|nr:MAG: cobalt-precorrin-5B (C(1))-methyltransferase [Candidatus Manganitrophaceae bacterium]